jgi:hypothetical protein
VREPIVPRPPADAAIVGSLHYEPCCNLAPRPPRQRTAAECTVSSAQRCVRVRVHLCVRACVSVRVHAPERVGTSAERKMCDRDIVEDDAEVLCAFHEVAPDHQAHLHRMGLSSEESGLWSAASASAPYGCGGVGESTMGDIRRR